MSFILQDNIPEYCNVHFSNPLHQIMIAKSVIDQNPILLSLSVIIHNVASPPACPVLQHSDSCIQMPTLHHLGWTINDTYVRNTITRPRLSTHLRKRGRAAAFFMYFRRNRWTDCSMTLSAECFRPSPGGQALTGIRVLAGSEHSPPCILRIESRLRRFSKTQGVSHDKVGFNSISKLLFGDGLVGLTARCLLFSEESPTKLSTWRELRSVYQHIYLITSSDCGFYALGSYSVCIKKMGLPYLEGK